MSTNIPLTLFWFIVLIGDIFFVFGVISAIYFWLKGITRPLIRLGNGLARRKIAVFAKSEKYNMLRDILLDSKLFGSNNIVPIHEEGDVGKAEDATLFLVYWPDWHGQLDLVIDKKTDAKALIVYAPKDIGDVPIEIAKKINDQRNSLLVNFRGRLLNDVLVSMMTTGYKR